MLDAFQQYGRAILLYSSETASLSARTRPSCVIISSGLLTLIAKGSAASPALFKTLADEVGLDWTVSLETLPGKDLASHIANKREFIDQPWDAVVLHGYSTLDAERPRDPTRYIAAALTLADLLHGRNPQAQVDLMATWSRADQTYRPDGHWFHQPITHMADDILAASRQPLTTGSGLHAVVPVGTASNRAMRDSLADPNPYDGLAFGQVNLWSWNQYHASAEEYYLEALVVFGAVTALDPRNLAETERDADDIGRNPKVAAQLRNVAAAELAVQRNSY